MRVAPLMGRQGVQNAPVTLLLALSDPRAIGLNPTGPTTIACPSTFRSGDAAGGAGLVMLIDVASDENPQTLGPFSKGALAALQD